MAAGLLLVSIGTAVYHNHNAADKAVNQNTIQREKICSEHNQGACQALFERLAKNISPAQRKQLACDVLSALDRRATRHLRVVSGCPTER